MLGALWGFLGFAATVVAGIASFTIAREFVRSRLRFVDAVRHPMAPWLAGAVVVLVGMPIAALLPLITATTATVAGVAAGFGTASGVKALKSGN
jgi:hypothetical protein